MSSSAKTETSEKTGAPMPPVAEEHNAGKLKTQSVHLRNVLISLRGKLNV